MEKIPERAIIKSAKIIYPNCDYRIGYHNENILLQIIVDVSKMDKNHVNYNEEYREIFFPAVKKSLFFDPKHKFENLCTEISKFLTLPKFKLRPAFWFENYNYLDEIEKEIKVGISKSKKPEVEFEFYLKTSHPLTDARYSNYSKPNDNYNYTKDFLEELEQLTNLKLINNYNNTFQIKRD